MVRHAGHSADLQTHNMASVVHHAPARHACTPPTSTTDETIAHATTCRQVAPKPGCHSYCYNHFQKHFTSINCLWVKLRRRPKRHSTHCPLLFRAGQVEMGSTGNRLMHAHLPE
jgi:hypothetical protein